MILTRRKSFQLTRLKRLALPPVIKKQDKWKIFAPKFNPSLGTIPEEPSMNIDINRYAALFNGPIDMARLIFLQNQLRRLTADNEAGPSQSGRNKRSANSHDEATQAKSFRPS